MTLLILHLSDIHIKNSTDPILKRHHEIAATTFQHLAEASSAIILISGDITQSGSKDEYKLASKFLEDIQRSIRSERKIPVNFVLAPGNHDCDLSGDQEARLAIISNIPKKVDSIPASYISGTTKVQREFFSLKKKLENKDILKFDNPLWWTYTFTVDSSTVSMDVLNASWMSTIHEQQGNLVFPFEMFQNVGETSVDLRIGILHHPLNWYNQSNYLAFRSFLHRLEDLIFSGHEHQSSGRLIDDKEDGQCLYIEGACLQSREPSSANESSFNVAIINMATRKYRHEKYYFKAGRYSVSDESIEWADFRPLPKRGAVELQLSKPFKETLNDPGATLKHPSGKTLKLEDFYVYPDFDEDAESSASGEAKGAKKRNSSILLRIDEIDSDVLIQGDDESGKTRLLYRLINSYHLDGKLPLLIRGEKIKNTHASDISILIRQAITEQYGETNLTPYLQTPTNQKLILIDDFDRIALSVEKKNKILSDLKKRSHRIILTVGESFAVQEFFGGTDIFGLSAFRSFKILPLGYARRHELIKKWNRIGGTDTRSNNDFHRACDEAEQLIENTKLQHVATTVPIFVLSLLQAVSSGISVEAHNSAFAHYYYFLIVGALDSANVPRANLGLILSVCYHLSWYIKKHGDDHEISEQQYREFTKLYSTEWTSINDKDILDVLVSSKLMSKEGDAIKFTYPYTFYYFLGKYASESIDQNEVQEYIKYCLDHLYARECANTLLFLAHHSGDSKILSQLVKTIDKHFSTLTPVSLSKADVESIRTLLSQAPNIKYLEQKPEDFRKSRAETNDELSGGDGLENKPNEGEKDSFQEVVSLLKAIEITGILLTHQFSSYSRTAKNNAISSIFNGSMRAVQSLFSYFSDTDELIKSISSRMHNKLKGASPEQTEQIIRHGIAFMLRMMTASFVMKAGAAVKSEDLIENVEAVTTTNSTCANKLIQLSQELQRPSRLPRLKISRLIKEESENPAVMGVLQLLILFRLYMYETEYDDKDWAMSIFSLSGQRANVEVKGSSKYQASIGNRRV